MPKGPQKSLLIWIKSLVTVVLVSQKGFIPNSVQESHRQTANSIHLFYSPITLATYHPFHIILSWKYLDGKCNLLTLLAFTLIAIMLFLEWRLILVIVVHAGLIGQTYYKDFAECNDISPSNDIFSARNSRMDENIELLGWDLPSLGSCLYCHSFHPPEEENKGYLEEVRLVNKCHLYLSGAVGVCFYCKFVFSEHDKLWKYLT